MLNELPAPTKGDRTRQALLEAAIVRFAREGYRGTSVADVCRDAGLSTTASYPYFANKEALFVAAVDEDVAGLIADAVSLVAIDEQPDAWGTVLMQALVDHMPGHPLAGRIVRGLEPEFTMRLLHIPALQDLRKTVTELIRHEQTDGRVRQDIDASQTANGMVVIVISLLMATMQTGADAEG
ncbi:MAG TPA: TetR/AcrR family transcriptional regulator, partial [Acidimicrobiales bacterium]